MFDFRMDASPFGEYVIVSLQAWEVTSNQSSYGKNDIYVHQPVTQDREAPGPDAWEGIMVLYGWACFKTYCLESQVPYF